MTDFKYSLKIGCTGIYVLMTEAHDWHNENDCVGLNNN